jgi:glycyl-tRNA synthetase beta chain
MLQNLEKSPKISEDQVRRAASLCKCDLLSDMVGEFPELQGVMGRYYAIHQKENVDVALALDEHYLPRFSGDELPGHILGQVISIADKLDTIVGIFAIGKKPTGTRDPFGLRRQSIGVLRIIIEEELDFDLRNLVTASLRYMPEALRKPEVIDEVFVYLQERARGYFQDHNSTSDQIASVFATKTGSPLDMQKRLQALQKFVQMPAAPNLAAANKRVANILKKNSDAIKDLSKVDINVMTEKSEYVLYQALQTVHGDVDSLMQAQRYTDVLLRLARLKDPIDNFFNDVMVMSDDPAERNNRLSLLLDFHTISTNVADLSLLDLSPSEDQ